MIGSEHQDLKVRTKQSALQIVRLYGSLPKTTEAQVMGKKETDELIAILVTIVKNIKSRRKGS